MKTDFAHWLRRPERARSYFLYASAEAYLTFCRHILTQRLKEMYEPVIESYPQELLIDDLMPLQNQPGLFGPVAAEKAIVVESATDKALSLIEYADKTVTLIFPALIGTSVKKLKDVHEKANDRQLISCYLNSPADKTFFINTLLQKYNVKANAEALQFLIQRVDEESENLVTDIAKCALYCEGKRVLTLDDVQNCCRDVLGHDVQDVIDAVASKNRQQVITEYQKVELAGVEDIMLLRMLGVHFLKLLSLKEATSQGKSVDEAMRFVRPPVFFKAQPILKMQLAKWSVEGIFLVIEKLRQRESHIKLGRPQADMTMGRFLLALTVL